MTCKRVNDKFVNTLFEDLECWTGLHLLHTAFAVVVSIIFIAISIVVAMTYFDSQSTSNDPTARVNSKGELFYIYEKIVLTYIYAFVNGQDYHWPLIVILFVLSYIGYTTFSNHWPYYNDKMTIYMSVIAGIYVWGNICLIVTKILENAPFNGAL